MTLFNRLFRREKSIDELMREFNDRLMKRDEKTVRRLIRSYRKIAPYIDLKLREVEKLINLAPDDLSPDQLAVWILQEARYMSLMANVAEAVQKYGEGANHEIEERKRTAYREGETDAVKLMTAEVRGAQALGLKVPEAFRTLNEGVIEQITGAFSPQSPLRRLFVEYGQSAVSKAEEAFVTMLANGENPRVIARRLAEEIEELTAGRALKIAANETMRAYTTSQQLTYEANSDVIIGSRIVEALDSRTCVLCWARHGTIVEHGQPFYRHIKCRGALAPVTAFSKKRATGPEEFALLSPEEQKRQLGPARYKLYKDGRINLEDILATSRHPTWGPQLGKKTLTNLKPAAPGTYAPPEIGEGVTSILKQREAKGIVAK